MISVTDNELMTDVSTRTPMGNRIREYWIPFMFSPSRSNPGTPTITFSSAAMAASFCPPATLKNCLSTCLT
jgi:hypothetical protein